uniref:Galactosylgalactosylxylosylprotein 3-beta-glucuronosyltransferase n=1 Tax=Setaria digitata TaxID=48799 RepID=A0A915Q5G3_9BILA
MRSIQKVGVWPVGLVGGLIVETAKFSEGKNVSFNSLWKPERPFPIDMAAFAINLSLALDANAFFTYNVPRGYQESHFLTALGLKRSDLELKANGCTKVYVWHTRTERTKLSQHERSKFWQGLLNDVESDASMGERKGQNFYYPPDFDYKKHKSLNSYHGTHALRERAAKIKQGILIIRFEMPFNIWCLGCNNHVGMGVRYNAEKKKIGMYYTTPLYEFRMKCHLCDNYFVIRTDPEHFDYELVEGCRRQEKRYDPSTIDQLGAVDRGFSRQLESDHMFQVEHVEQDKEKAASSADKVDKLEWIQERMRDDFAANQALRRSFNRDKTDLKEMRIRDEDLLKRMSLNIKLVSESDQDKKLAAAVLRYKDIKFSQERLEEKRQSILNKPIFSSSQPSTSSKNGTTQKRLLKMKFRKNERGVFDSGSSTRGGAEQVTPGSLGIIKRIKFKNEEQDEIDVSKKKNLSNVKYESTELLCGNQRNLTAPKNENLSIEKTDLSNGCKLTALVADYGGDSSSDTPD